MVKTNPIAVKNAARCVCKAGYKCYCQKRLAKIAKKLLCQEGLAPWQDGANWGHNYAKRGYMAFEIYFTVNEHPQKLWFQMMLNPQVNDNNAYLSVRGVWTKTSRFMFRKVTLELI